MCKADLYLYSGILAILVLLFIILSCWDTGSGQHIGVVTGVKKHGFLFKTNTAYIQTSARSSRSHSYCVTNKHVLGKLKDMSKIGKPVIIKFHSKAFYWPWTCGGEKSIIDAVSKK